MTQIPQGTYLCHIIHRLPKVQIELSFLYFYLLSMASPGYFSVQHSVVIFFFALTTLIDLVVCVFVACLHRNVHERKNPVCHIPHSSPRI